MLLKFTSPYNEAIRYVNPAYVMFLEPQSDNPAQTFIQLAAQPELTESSFFVEGAIEQVAAKLNGGMVRLDQLFWSDNPTDAVWINPSAVVAIRSHKSKEHPDMAVSWIFITDRDNYFVKGTVDEVAAKLGFAVQP